MTDSTPRPLPCDTSSIRAALEFKLTDHLLIRACEAGEEGQKDKLRGLVRPPPAGKLYGPSILVTWAHKLVERRYVKPFHIGRSGGRTLTDHLFSIGLRLIGFLGSWGIMAACASAGLVAGLAFLPLRIFTSTQVTLYHILLPMLLGTIFVLWQFVNLALYLSNLFKHRGGAENRDSHDDGFGPKMLLAARRALPSYIRWNANLGWCVFWIVVLISMFSQEYLPHHETDRDYVYHSQYMPLEKRLSWLHKLSAIMPEFFRLPDESLVWGDRDYREDGYRLTGGTSSQLALLAETAFLRGDDKVVLAYKPEPGQTIMGVIFTEFGPLLDQSPPFEQQASAKQMSDSPAPAIAVEGEGDSEQLAIQLREEGLNILKKGGRKKPLTFLADGVVAVTNSTEYVISLDALPRKLEIREEGSAEGESTTISLERIERSYSLSRLTKPSGYARHWFWFLFGVTITFGLAPRLAAVPVFGLVYIICKWNLYRELSKEPFASIIEELNQRPKATTRTEDGHYHNEPLTPRVPAPVKDKLPHKDILAVGYGVSATADDVRKLGRASDFTLFERPAGDANANAEVMKWLDQHESFGRFLVCSKLIAIPDRPLIKFLQRVVSKGLPCELAFLDMPKHLDAAGDRLATRIQVWQDVMKKADLFELLPADLRNRDKKGSLDGD